MFCLTPGIKVYARVAGDTVLWAPEAVAEGSLVQPPPSLDTRNMKLANSRLLWDVFIQKKNQDGESSVSQFET